MQRQLKDYIIISLKGMAMGAADVVPGVSGGTIAFISGIYEELITSLNNINFSLLETFNKKGFSAAWKQLNGNFLLALFIGIGVSIISLVKVIKWLLENEPVLLWSFFFGLVLASILFIGKQITNWNINIVIALLLSTFIAYYITSLSALSTNNSWWFLFISGALAICAMILPGISGAFILVLLGAYKPLLDAIDNKDFKTLSVVGLGAIVGLLSFSKILKWLFKNYRNLTLAILTGFVLGSLNKIWPWKKTISVMVEKTGEIIPFSNISELGTLSVFQKKIQNFESYKTISEKSISPILYSEINKIDNQLLFSIGLMIFGFLSILILEKFGNRKKTNLNE